MITITYTDQTKPNQPVFQFTYDGFVTVTVVAGDHVRTIAVSPDFTGDHLVPLAVGWVARGMHEASA
jgi:hypothetical protein